MDSIKVVLGLGNPGARYRRTRHNVGFRVVECLAARAGARFHTDRVLRSRALQTDYHAAGNRVTLAKPRTYMNHSGRAALAVIRAGRIPVESMLVVYDDADLRFGTIRLRRGGGAGGHNGIRSLIETLGTSEFPRLKVGVRGEGRSERELADYVLDEFEEDEWARVEALIELAADAADAVVADGLSVAMNRFNGRSVDATDEAEPSEEN